SFSRDWSSDVCSSDLEPERVLPAFTFDRLSRTLEVATAFAAPYLERFVGDAERAADGAELVVRVLLSYALNPTATISLTDEAAEIGRASCRERVAHSV